MTASGRGPALMTVGHGTLPAEGLARLLELGAVEELVDVRTAPGSRRHPQFARGAMEVWVPAAGVAYRWEKDLGGFRKPVEPSANPALRNPSFRGYADYMATETFRVALDRLVEQASEARVAVMCSEAVWWRCHRRLIADALVLGRGVAVEHLMHDGRRVEHRLTEGVRAGDDGLPVYDVGVDRPLGP